MACLTTVQKNFFIREEPNEKKFSRPELQVIDTSTSKEKEKAESSKRIPKVNQPRWEEDDICLENVVESDCDSEEARSAEGSDDDGEKFPTFNVETDLKGKVNLFLGLKFDSIYDLRTAVQHHSIQNRYAYFFRHNGSGRFEVYCRYRCDCPWNSKKGKIMWCKCTKDELKCVFKVRARQLAMSDQYQIKDIHLGHDCGFYHSSNKVASAYLAEKYLADWKSDPNWKLTSFIDRVYRDSGIKIKYWKAWFTRCRVKQILYGDSSEQYAKVYNYASALLKFNPGSTVIVSVENSKTSNEPYFSRMYVCLEACKSGYKEGCRPIIGVDGCHLKGPYPGMILAAIGKDGNNNIFPIAWAIVEVENTSSWTWFLELLVADIGHVEGGGLTLMSDRQKGLLEAISVVAPKADVRFCVRHIWANFKLKFNGTIYKEFFWKAAKATTKQKFENSLSAIKFLSEEAYNYLNAISSKHWSRHAFTTTSKSNMVTNKMCETFNAVIKDARDKPVITCLEWIRRYIMRRHAEKWDGVQTYGGRFMPYTSRVLGWIMEGAKDCSAVHSRTDEWEVDTTDDRLTVNLRTKSCSCNHFMLTGIPCAHAFSCIMEKRGRPKDYVDDYYNKERYIKAYNSHIKPMPGFNHWEPSSMPEPPPPPFRNMPGRPSSKKRIKEVGEEAEEKAKKFKKVGGPLKCSKCRQTGHKRNKCKNQPAAPKPPASKKGGRPESNDPWVIANRKIRETRAKMMSYVPPSGNQLSSTQNVENAPSQSSIIGQCTTSTSNTNPKPAKVKAISQKLQVKPTKKKVKSLKDDLLVKES